MTPKDIPVVVSRSGALESKYHRSHVYLSSVLSFTNIRYKKSSSEVCDWHVLKTSEIWWKTACTVMKDRIFLCFADPDGVLGWMGGWFHRDDLEHTCQTCFVSNDGPLGTFKNSGAYSHNRHCHTSIASSGGKCVMLNIIQLHFIDNFVKTIYSLLVIK